MEEFDIDDILGNINNNKTIPTTINNNNKQPQ